MKLSLFMKSLNKDSLKCVQCDFSFKKVVFASHIFGGLIKKFRLCILRLHGTRETRVFVPMLLLTLLEM